jgi:uncharacterized membrane protein
MENLQQGQPAQHRSRNGLAFLALGLLILGWLLYAPPGLLGKADAIGYAVCHRIDLRSFHLGDRPLPLCARCTGMFLGALLGIVYQGFIGRRRTGAPPGRIIVILALLLVAFALDGLNSYLTLFPGFQPLYKPHNTFRLLTGTGMGLVIAAALFPAFNLSVWRTSDPRPALSNWRSLGGLVILGLGIDLLVLTENPVLLYPLALISAAAVLVLLTMVYTMAWLMVLRLENRFNRPFELLLPLAGGFAVGLIQIGVLDLGRFLLTGTWDGFHIG